MSKNEKLIPKQGSSPPLTQQSASAPTTAIPQHNRFEFEVYPPPQPPPPPAEQQSEEPESYTITFNSEFDSGNCGRVIQKQAFEYDVYTAPDRDTGSESEGHSKSWFYFSITGFKAGNTVKLNIQNIHMLWSLWNNRACSHYKPVFRIGADGEYQKLSTEVQIYQLMGRESLVLSFEYTFETDSDEVFFSFSYPYEYSRCVNMVNDITAAHLDDEEIYLHSEVLVRSPQSRNIHMITISSRDNIIENTFEEPIELPLFPELKKRAARFKSKQYVLITSRVHPGETPSSYALEGVIKFLLNKNDARAALLRQFFVFLIVPMLNPDGVYNGHYRMDIFNNNLNRFYKLADEFKQPAVFAIRKIVEQLQVDRKLFFYIDLHAHAGKKGHFVYGNAYDDLAVQIETQTFAKLLSMNCPHFEYNFCNFSKRHMKARDKLEEMTKEGCGRVQVHEMTKIIHAYTLECGFHQATQLNVLSPPSNPDFKLNEQKGLEYDPAEDVNSDIYKSNKNGNNNTNSMSSITFTPILYENVGKAILVSILDIFEKNPYSRIPTSAAKSMDKLRRQVGQECVRIDRFRTDPFAYKKVRRVRDFLQEPFFQEFERKRVFRFDTPLLSSVQWPEDLQGNFLRLHVHSDICKQMQAANMPPGQVGSRLNKYYAVKSRVDSNNRTNTLMNTSGYQNIDGYVDQNLQSEENINQLEYQQSSYSPVRTNQLIHIHQIYSSQQQQQSSQSMNESQEFHLTDPKYVLHRGGGGGNVGGGGGNVFPSEQMQLSSTPISPLRMKQLTNIYMHGSPFKERIHAMSPRIRFGIRELYPIDTSSLNPFGMIDRSAAAGFDKNGFISATAINYRQTESNLSEEPRLIGGNIQRHHHRNLNYNSNNSKHKKKNGYEKYIKEFQKGPVLFPVKKFTQISLQTESQMSRNDEEQNEEDIAASQLQEDEYERTSYAEDDSPIKSETQTQPDIFSSPQSLINLEEQLDSPDRKRGICLNIPQKFHQYNYNQTFVGTQSQTDCGSSGALQDATNTPQEFFSSQADIYESTEGPTYNVNRKEVFIQKPQVQDDLLQKFIDGKLNSYSANQQRQGFTPPRIAHAYSETKSSKSYNVIDYQLSFSEVRRQSTNTHVALQPMNRKAQTQLHSNTNQPQTSQFNSFIPKYQPLFVKKHALTKKNYNHNQQPQQQLQSAHFPQSNHIKAINFTQIHKQQEPSKGASIQSTTAQSSLATTSNSTIISAGSSLTTSPNKKISERNAEEYDSNLQNRKKSQDIISHLISAEERQIDAFSKKQISLNASQLNKSTLHKPLDKGRKDTSEDKVPRQILSFNNIGQSDQVKLPELRKQKESLKTVSDEEIYHLKLGGNRQKPRQSKYF